MSAKVAFLSPKIGSLLIWFLKYSCFQNCPKCLQKFSIFPQVLILSKLTMKKSNFIDHIVKTILNI